MNSGFFNFKVNKFGSRTTVLKVFLVWVSKSVFVCVCVARKFSTLLQIPLSGPSFFMTLHQTKVKTEEMEKPKSGKELQQEANNFTLA